MITPSNIILLLAATATALMAGLFFAWSCSVTPGIARLSDPGYITSMQSMNEAILNPVFFTVFFGAALLLPVAAWMHYASPLSLRFGFLLGASVAYIVGVLGVTMMGNVPLNEALKSFDVQTATGGQMALQRVKFEGPWNSLNMVRTVASFLSAVLVIIACIGPKHD